jgi:hypothetical protein
MPIWTFSPRHSGDDAKSLSQRRAEALERVLGVIGAVGILSGAPTPTLEAPKQAVITIGDALLLKSIYEVYFDDVPDGEEPFREMLSDAGLKLLAGGAVAYVGVKASEGVVAEVLNFIPGLGWLLSGLVTASVTATVACAWWKYCDSRYRSQADPLAVVA